MRATLGIVTAGPVAAAVVGDLAESAVDTRQQALSGALHCVMKALEQARARIDDIGLIAVCTGPGSFTGLRIGVALAKSIAQAQAIPVAGVSSYDIAANAVGNTIQPSASIVEGKRGFYYARFFRAAEGPLLYISGSLDGLEDELSGLPLYNLKDVSAAEQALRTARLGRSIHAERPAEWQRVQIDYGQRSNAEINWEGRADRARRGAAANPAKSKGR